MVERIVGQLTQVDQNLTVNVLEKAFEVSKINEQIYIKRFSMFFIETKETKQIYGRTINCQRAYHFYPN